MSSLALPGFLQSRTPYTNFFPREQEDVFQINQYGRVTTGQISVHSLPQDNTRIVRQRYRDDILTIYAETTSPHGPYWNNTWYRVWGGYVHSGYVQKVEINHQPVPSSLSAHEFPFAYHLAQVTVPYTQSYRYTRQNSWEMIYRLYYETTHWVTGIDEGPDGKAWFRLYDELLRIEYFAPALHLRLFKDEELAPISPDLAFEEKKVELDLARQTLTAYEKDKIVLTTTISSGIHSRTTTNGIPTQTPSGRFNISVKMPSKHMGDGRLTDNLEDYELVGVPWTCFFHQDGYAIHGTYWHNNFGIRMSRGCVNMRTPEAMWLFRWLTPVSNPNEIDRRGYGTQLVIR